MRKVHMFRPHTLFFRCETAGRFTCSGVGRRRWAKVTCKRCLKKREEKK
jgi:hypothetical protein